MKCPKCGADSIGNFCTECGYKFEKTTDDIDQVNASQDTNAEDSVSDSSEIKDNGSRNNINSNKMPFYFSGWFIFLIAYIGGSFTCGISYIAGIVLACIRRSKYKDKKVNNNLILGGLIAPAAIFAIIFIVALVASSNEDKQIETFITSGQYEEAENYIEDKYGKGSSSYVKKMLKVYEAQEDYDSAAILILDEIAADELLSIDSTYIDKLKMYVNHTSEDVTEKINSKFNDIEKAEEAEAQAKAKAEENEKAKLEAESKKAEAEAKKAEAEAEAKKAEKEKAKAEAEKAASEAESKKAEADKAASEAESKKAEADKAASEATSKRAEADKAASEATSKKAEADKAASESTSNQGKSEKSQNGNSNTSSKTAGDSSIPTKREIEEKSKWITYDDVMRYRDKYTGCYVSTVALLGNVVLNSDNKQYNAVIGEYQMSDESYYGEFYSEDDFEDKYFIIKNCKQDNTLSWVKGDTLYICGKYVGIETYYQTNEYTDKQIKIEIPIIEVYYDELLE